MKKKLALVVALAAALPMQSAFARPGVQLKTQRVKGDTSKVAPLSVDTMAVPLDAHFVNGATLLAEGETVGGKLGKGQDVQDIHGAWNEKLGGCWDVAASLEAERSHLTLSALEGAPKGLLEQLVKIDNGVAVVSLGDIYSQPGADGLLPVREIRVPLGYYGNGHNENLQVVGGKIDYVSLIGDAIAQYRIDHEAETNKALPPGTAPSTKFASMGRVAAQGGDSVQAFAMLTRRKATMYANKSVDDLGDAPFDPTDASKATVVGAINTARAGHQPVVADTLPDQKTGSDALARIKAAVDNKILLPAALQIAALANIGLVPDHSFRVIEGSAQRTLSRIEEEFLVEKGLLNPASVKDGGDLLRRTNSGRAVVKALYMREIGGKESLGDKDPMTSTPERRNLGRTGGYFLMPERAFSALYGLVHIGVVQLPAAVATK